MKKTANSYLLSAKYYLKYCHYLAKLFHWKAKHHWKKEHYRRAAILTGKIALVLIAMLFFNRSDNLRLGRSSDKNFLYQTKGEDLSIFIGNKKSNQPSIKATTKDGAHSLSFLYQDAQAADKKPTKKGNVLTFKDVTAGMDITYQTLPNGLKEELILRSQPDDHFFIFTTEITGSAAPQVVTTNTLQPIIYDDQDNYLFHFEKPFAYDATGARTDNAIIQLRPSPTNPNYFKTILAVDKDWLFSPDRVYPITIDPTIVHDTSDEFATGTLNRAKDTGASSTPTIETWYQELAADENTLGLWHMNQGADNSCSGGQDACDSSGNGYHGTFNGNAAFTGSGILGTNSTTFDGTGDFIALGDPDIVGSFMTIEAWIRPTTITGGFDAIYSKETLSLYNNTGDLFLYIGGDQLSPDDVLVINEWQHVAATIDEATNTLILYLNGKEIARNSAWTGTIPTGANNAYIGRYSAVNQEYFQGQIDEVRISNSIRAPEEIKLAASRRPYSVYTSAVIDLYEEVLDFDELNWNELGVATGDGETVFSSTNLVAQWNLNETSGTTANNDAEGTSCGGTPANCDGSLSGFDSTASQDADQNSSWTANNRRWGAGALMFDGVDNYINLGDNASLLSNNTGSISFWAKPGNTASKENTVFGYGGDGTDQTLFIYLVTDTTGNNFDVGLFTEIPTANKNQFTTDRSFPTGQWYHIVVASNGSAYTVYVNGIAQPFTMSQGSNDGEWIGDITGGANDLASIGARKYEGTLGLYYEGILDSVQFYSQAMSASEVMANYNANNVEFQTRVGPDTSPDDGNWDAWSPTSGETAITAFDSSITDDLISYWKLDEASGTAYDSWGTNSLTETSGTIPTATGKINGSRDFELGDTEDLRITDNASVSTGDIDFTFSAWVNLESKPASVMTIVSKFNGLDAEHQLRWNNSNDRLEFATFEATTGEVCTATGDNLGAPSLSTWYFITAWHDAAGSTCNIKINDGTTNSGAESGVIADGGANFRIGSVRSGISDTQLFDGLIDEVGFWKRTLTASEMTALYASGEPTSAFDNTDVTNFQNTGGIRPTTETFVKTEGDGSQKIEIGHPQIDGSTVALWHLDETNGDNAGVDIFDATTNNNDGEFNGTNLASAVVDGINGRARNFNGTNDYISIPYSASVKPTEVTVMGWIKHDVTGAGGILSWQYDFNGSSAAAQGFAIYTEAGDTIRFYSRGTGGEASTDTIPFGEWTHFAITSSNTASETRFYINGVPDSGGAKARAGTLTYDTSDTSAIGTRVSAGTPGVYFDGSIDELVMYGSVLNAEQIAEAFKMGANHYLNRTISSTDLTAKNKLAFNIASDRQGTFLETTIGESALTNNQPNANTSALWRFDEVGNDSCNAGNDDVCDSSGNGLHGDEVSSPPIAPGLIGNARDFDGSLDNISFGASTNLLRNKGSGSASIWIQADSLSTAPTVLDISDGVSAGSRFEIGISTAGAVSVGGRSTDAETLQSVTSAASAVSTNSWYNIVGTIDYANDSIKIYVNGVEVSTTGTPAFGAAATSDTSPTVVYVGQNATPSNRFNGRIDEVSVYDTLLTATDVRQMYEKTLRTYPITIDFAAKLTTTDLITGSTDTTFQIDETAYGATDKSEHLFNGDKIIVRETVDDTTYTAQGTVISTQKVSGDTKVVSWDSASTFPSAGFTANASVFKWQTEYFDLTNLTLDSFIDGITTITTRVTNGSEGRTVWLDDLRSVGEYLTTPAGSTITSDTGERYLQYRAILSSSDEAVSASMSAVTIDYQSGAAAGHWKFDEGANDTCSGGSNDTCDTSINSNDGAITGATWQPKDLCANGKCLFFDGSDDVVTVTSSDDISLSGQLASAFTIAGWAKPNSDGEGSVGEIWNKGTNNYARITNEGTDGLADLEVKLDLATTDATVTVTNGITLDTFSHISVTYTDDGDDEIQVYINGLLRGTSTDGDGAPATDANNLLIGGATGANFHGFIDDVKMFEVEKTAAEIKTLFIKDSPVQGATVSFDDPLTDGLTGYWPMDETAADSCTGGANDSCDESGNGFDLAWAGNTTVTVGKYGNGTTYDGTGDSAACTDANCGGTNNLDFGAGDQFSFGGWFKNTSASTDIYFGKKNSLAASTAGYIMQQTTGDTVRCVVADGTNVVQPNSTSTYNDGLWHHAFCTIGQDDVSLYIDGVLVDSDPNTFTDSFDNTDSFVVAESGAGTGDLTGQIDDVRVYRRALSEMEVTSLYNWAPGPVGYWPMDENTGTTTTYDKSGNSLNGTLTSVAETGWVPGKYGSAINFLGSPDEVTLGASTNLLRNIGEVTISAWIKTNSYTSAGAAIVDVVRGTGTSSRFEMRMTGGGQIAMNGRSGDAETLQTVLTSTNIPLNSWHYVTITTDYVNDSVKIYFDGLLQPTTGTATYTATVTSDTSPAEVNFAHDNSTANYFNGSIDEVKIYHYLRTPSQIIEDMNGDHPVGGSPLGSQIIRYKFDESNQSTANNEIGTRSGPGINPNTNSLIGWWNLDELSGNALDASDDYDLTETGGTIAVATGKVSNARDFELADTEWFAIADNTDFSMGDVPFTIGAWVNTESQAGIMQILNKFNSTGNTREYRVYYNNSTDRFEFNVTPNGTSTGEATATANNYGAVPASTWAFVIAYHDPTANTIGISVDAGSVNTTSYSAGVYDGTADFRIGSDSFPSQYWDGLIDEAFVYKKVLTQSEIEWLYNSGNGRTYSDLTLDGAVSGATWKNGSDCKVMGCLDFDGSDDVVTTDNSPQFDFDTALSSAVSFTAWINADSDGESDVGEIFDKGATTYCRTDSQGTTDLDLECSLDLGTTDATVNIADGLTTDTWHHIAMVYQDDSDDEIQVYIDGLLRGTSTDGVGSPATSDTNDLLIGGSSGANFDGTIDELHLYSIPLTLEQVLIDRNANSQASLGGVLGATEKSTITGGAGANPIGWWKLDENTGTVSTYDSSGNSYTGTLTSITSSSWVPGKLGSALDFDGTADYLSVSDNNALDFGTSNFSVSLWMKTSNTSGATILGKHVVGGNVAGWDIWANTYGANKAAFTFQETSDSEPHQARAVSTTDITDGGWHHIVGVRNGNTAYIYVDGILEASDASDGTPNVDNITDLIFARRNTTYFDGAIDEVKIWNYALSTPQVAYEYNRGGPVGWWRMDEGTGTTTTYDASGKGYNLTMNTMAEDDWVTGKYSTALDFDGGSDYLSCTDAACGGTTKLDFGVSPAFSYGAWFKTSTTGVTQRIIGKKNTSAANAGYMLVIRTSNDARCKIADGTNDSDIAGPSTVTDGQWHHVMCVHTGSALYMYQDGVLVASDSDTSDVTSTLDTTVDFRIGAQGDGGSLFTGQVDDARVYNYALSATQIRNIMNLGAQRFGN